MSGTGTLPKLFWLAFLLTGDRKASLEATVAGLDINSSADSRQLVIAAALATVGQQLICSERYSPLIFFYDGPFC